MSRAHVLVAVGFLINGACAAARQPSHDPAVSGVATGGEASAPPRTAGGRSDASRERARAASQEWEPEAEAVVEGEAPAAAAGGLADQAGEADAPKNLLEAIVACKRVQDDHELRVGCSTEFIDGMLTMMVGFETAVDAAKYSGEMEARLSTPFCEAANGAGTSASVYVLVANAARQLDCELGTWGSWFELVAEPARSVEAPN